MKNRYKRKLIFAIAILCLSLVSCKSKTEPINNIASWTPDDDWAINGIDIRDDYANFILLPVPVPAAAAALPPDSPATAFAAPP